MASSVSVTWNNVCQPIDGFGASSAFTGGNITTAQADLFFSQSLGIGLSFLRTLIPTDGTVGPTGTLQAAVSRGAKVWATPWSPPAAWKTNKKTTNGGGLLPGDYQKYADYLCSYVTTLKSQTGINLYALSIQNEPDYVAPWDSCIWTGAEFQNFIKNFLAPTFAAAALTTEVIMPESSGWDFTLAAPTLNDPVAAAGVQIIAAHGYSGSIAPCPLAQSHGKRLWETEVSDFAAFDSTIRSGLVYAKKIHDWIITGGVNAWHYWWLISGNPDNEGLLGSGGTNYQVTKRLYAFGNFSKFIRPGFVRIAATPSPAAGVLVSAYKDPNAGNFAIVAINQGSSKVSLNVAFNGFTAHSVTPWVTSASLDLVQQPPLPAGGAFAPTLAAQSVTTFVGLGH